jgi:hypothetical protein
MTQNKHLMYLCNELPHVELPEGLVFASPDEAAAYNDEQALHDFLQEFEDNHEPLEVVGLFPVESGE